MQENRDLDPYTEKDLRDLEEMFGTPGWKVIAEEAERSYENLKAAALEQTTSMEALARLQGRAQALAELLNLPFVVENLQEELAVSRGEREEPL